MAMQHGTVSSRTGRLTVLAGPEGLMSLIPHAKSERNVTVGEGVLSWVSDAPSRSAAIPGDRIRSVSQHNAAFVVHLKPNANGLAAVTFGTPSDSDAAAWIAAVEAIIRPDSPTPTAGSSRPAQPAETTASPDPTPIRLTYMIDGETKPIEKEYALLVVACDPRALYDICDYTPEERAIFEALTNYMFHITLLEVDVSSQQQHAVIFAPKTVEAMKGNVYAFRNESAKQFGLDCANKMQKNLVTVYQLGPSGMTEAEFEQIFETELPNLPWWPFGSNYDKITSVTTPYFDHFGGDSLKAGLPWNLLERQGRQQTLFVHASACFESVLHCWSYANLMLQSVAGAGQALPFDSHAPIVVLGAGVSGILFAARLRWMGYDNVDILESTDRYGGKTHTVVRPGPYPPDQPGVSTVCELGTCYLSPAYDPLVEYLEQQDVLCNNSQIDFTQGDPNFRGVVTAGELSSGFQVAPVIAYGQYVILKAEDELGISNGFFDRLVAQMGIALALAYYGVLHIEYMGFDTPMPPQQNASTNELLDITFADLLSDNDMLVLVGALQYSYEVQGYGSLETISAYYGLMWITPPMTWAILRDALLGDHIKLVTAWTKGWGAVWTEIVEKLKLKITFSARTTNITRST